MNADKTPDLFGEPAPGKPLLVRHRLWEKGEWQDEPDELKWIDDATGSRCFIMRNPSGALCGYSSVLPGHPFFGLGYDARVEATPLRLARRIDMDKICVFSMLKEMLTDPEDHDGKIPLSMLFEIHGGLTYAFDHAPMRQPNGEWWFGFDCAHSGDYSPGMWRTELEKFKFERKLEKKLGRPLMVGHGIYRNMAYVKAETESLARQLATYA